MYVSANHDTVSIEMENDKLFAKPGRNKIELKPYSDAHFFIDDHDLYNFAVISLQAATMVKIHYSERLSMSNNFGQSGLSSMSYVSEIEIVGENSGS